MRWLSEGEVAALAPTATRLARARSAVAGGYVRGVGHGDPQSGFRRRSLVHSRTHHKWWYVVHLTVVDPSTVMAECGCNVGSMRSPQKLL